MTVRALSAAETKNKARDANVRDDTKNGLPLVSTEDRGNETNEPDCQDRSGSPAYGGLGLDDEDLNPRATDPVHLIRRSGLIGDERVNLLNMADLFKTDSPDFA